MNTKVEKKRKVWKIIGCTVLAIVTLWFCLTLYEYYRVRIDKRPLLCFGEKEDIENEKEISKTCYGPLYKYREYYIKETNAKSAVEFTLFFKEFNRKVNEYETK